MTYEETRTVLSIIKSNYFSAYKNIDAQVAQNQLDLWYAAFKDTPKKLVLAAVNQIIFYSNKEFPPKIGDINAKILELLSDNPDDDATEAWNTVREFIRSIGGTSEDVQRYRSLPDSIRRIYSYADLKSLSMARETDNTAYEKPRFIAAYKNVASENRMTLLQQHKYAELASEEKLKQIGFSEDEVKKLKSSCIPCRERIKLIAEEERSD